MPPHVAECRKQVVEPHARAQLPRGDAPATIHREEKREWPHEVGSNREEHPPFVARLEHQTERALLEVADAAVDLARYAARELLERTNLDGTDVDEVIFGQVVPSALVPNIGREVSLLPQFPKEIPAYSVNRACASATQAIASGHDQIVLGHADVVTSGGAEALSDIPILASRRLA